jgi:hypothetical protein
MNYIVPFFLFSPFGVGLVRISNLYRRDNLYRKDNNSSFTTMVEEAGLFGTEMTVVVAGGIEKRNLDLAVR